MDHVTQLTHIANDRQLEGERLMRLQGLRSTIRGKRILTTFLDMTAPRPLDQVNRQFKADRPNQLWYWTSPTFRHGRAGYT
ncbi:hypothetical protein SAMN04515620_14828 [Collimonas sp. OK607]|nr:hypothetical protein SAMN04515620_14828 [Collimonas sp. OK607]